MGGPPLQADLPWGRLPRPGIRGRGFAKPLSDGYRGSVEEWDEECNDECNDEGNGKCTEAWKPVSTENLFRQLLKVVCAQDM